MIKYTALYDVAIFENCLYTFYSSYSKRDMRKKNMANFSQIWNRASLGELNSSLCKIMKSHVLFQRISLIITCIGEEYYLLCILSGCQIIVRLQTVSNLTDLSLVIGPVADCYKQCNNHFGVNVSTTS